MAGDWGMDLIERLVAAYEPLRDEGNAGPMARYMRNQFPFLGIKTPARRAATREALRGLRGPVEGDLGVAVDGLWGLGEREYQYAGCEVAARWVGVCGPGFIEVVERLVTTKSWWDTVDSLAAHVAGPLVLAHPGLGETMDRWIESENVWLARTALLHQLRYKERTDVVRLFGYCQRRAGDREFFIRKAIGWALREYSKTDGDAVLGFVAAHEGELSGLSRREALGWVGRRGRREEGGGGDRVRATRGG